MNITVNALHVLLLSKFTADQKEQSAICGVRIEPAAPLPGAYLVALDDHKLGVIYDSQAEADQAITLKINPDLVRACKCLKKETARVIHVEDNRATVRYPFSDSPLYIQPGEAASPDQYPGWRALFRYEPSDRPMSAELLPPADRTVALSLGGDFGGMRFYPTIECGPIYVRVPAWPNFFGIIMPMKSKPDCPTFTAKPSWLPVSK